jgi:phage-related protein
MIQGIESLQNRLIALPEEIQRQVLDYVEFLIEKYQSGTEFNAETLAFPSEVNKKIEIALEQVKNGDVSSQAEADAKIEKWLSAK